MALDPIILNGIEFFTSRDSGTQTPRGGADAALERGTVYSGGVVCVSSAELASLISVTDAGPIAVTLPDGTVLSSALVQLSDIPLTAELSFTVDITIEELTA